MPKKQTVKGKYCAPSSEPRKSGESCYTRVQLVNIAKAYNRQYASKIATTGNKSELWQAIEQKMMDKCSNEWCWQDKMNMSGKDKIFRVERPVGKYQWLSTIDIRNVLKQYENKYSDFVFLGPVPRDFCNLGGNEVCNINLKSSRTNGKTKIGIVFNTDPSSESGKHWISMFIDISNPDPKKHEIGYFDSYGMAPLLPEIKSLVKKLQAQNPHIKLKLNCNSEMCTHTIQHQMNNSECGMYSINYIVERLTGKSWEELIVNQRWEDEEMVDMRRKYFRPAIGGDRHAH